MQTDETDASTVTGSVTERSFACALQRTPSRTGVGAGRLM